MGRWSAVILFGLLLLLLAAAATAAAPIKQIKFSIDDGFNETRDGPLFKFIGDNASIDGGALQLTPDTLNDDDRDTHLNKSGRIMWLQPFKLWLSDDDDVLASFHSHFLINIYRKSDWDAGQGLAFVIAPNLTIPSASHGQWLGLTNSSTDGNPANHIVAIEFDTEKQADFDPDDNHIGLNVNSVRSNKTVPLSDYNIEISPPQEGIKYDVWVEYDGNSKLMQVYMVKEGDLKPRSPLLNHTINLKNHLKQESYFGFAAATGDPAIQLNCVLKWSLAVDALPRNKDWTWLKIVIPALILIVMCGVGVGVLYANKRRGTGSVEEHVPNVLGTLKRLPGMPREFSYRELRTATNNFNETMRLGQGGFGVVYKGLLPPKDHHNAATTTEIAVKKFSRDNIQGKDDFLAELTIINRLRHKHLVQLVGWCYKKGKLLLVYDFMPNGSLDKHLFDVPNEKTLNWERRYKILTGIASALHYLHNEYNQKVVHRDLKASNIMLDADFNARLGDFGLARALENDRNSYAELGLGGVPGTIGYVAPECFHTGRATPESDVFGFGAVVLEVVCGRSPGTKIHHHQYLYSLVDWAWMLHREGCILEAVDERLGNNYAVDEAKRLLLLGLACSHPIAGERPQTQAIFQIISGIVPAPDVPPFKPIFTWPSMLTATTSTNDITLSNITSSSLVTGGTRSVTSSRRASTLLPV